VNPSPDIKADLTQSLRTLHLPTIRQCYEEVARQAEREQLSYERYPHELVQRECEERQENRTTIRTTHAECVITEFSMV
jgi:hypothetical protein